MTEKTQKGVFLTLDHSDIIVITPYGKELKFSSQKKRQVFMKNLHDRMMKVKINSNKLSQLIGIKFDLSTTYENDIYLKVYSELIYK